MNTTQDIEGRNLPITRGIVNKEIMKYDLAKNVNNENLLVTFRRERSNVSSFQRSYIYIMYIQM